MSSGQGIAPDSNAQEIESVIWDIRRNDLPRAYNRSLVDGLFNGEKPHSDQQAQQNNISVNCNFLEPTKISQDAQGQFTTAIFNPSQFFSVKVDRGPQHKRDEWSEVITTKLRRAMKNGQSAGSYRENLRSIFGQLVLHGIGPMQWPDRECWRPEMQAVGDVMLPSRTLLTMDNLPYWATYRRYTASQLYRMTHGPKVDPGWNVEVADKCIAWAAKQYGQTTSGTDLIWHPERVQEDIKAGSIIYMSDAVPTINCWDVKIYDDSTKNSGWKRKIILDAPSINEAGFSPSTGLNNVPTAGTAKNILDSRNQFLYDSRKRNYASKLSEMVHFQFANGSVVAPFRYDTIRSLGWLLYTPCQLQNRLRSAYTKAAFEACSQYFRTDNPEDAQRVLKLDLIDECVIPNGINFVGAQERWRTDSGLINDVLAQNRQTIADNSTAYTKNFGYGEKQQAEKTATQITAEVNAASALVGSMLEQFYGYENFKNREICRRFCIKNSKDADVRWFRNECLKAGVPEEVLDVDCWDIAEERVMGNGNTQLAIAQAQLIMQFYQLLDPNAQRVALRTYMFAVTRDAAKTAQLAPEEPLLTTRSVHDAQVSVATLLAAQPMGLMEGVSHAEYAATLIGALGLEVQKIGQSGGVPTAAQLAGFQNLAGETVDGQPIQGNGAANHIAILAQDKESKAIVKQLGDLLGQQMNQVKAMSQRLQEQQQSQNGNGNGQPELSPEDTVKLKGQLIMSQAKAANMRESHQQRSQQKAEIHQQKLQEQQAQHQLDNAAELRRVQVDESAKDLTTAATISREALKPTPKSTSE